MKIAISAEISELQNNFLFDRNVCKKFPGAEWTYFLKKNIKHRLTLVSADVALKNVESKLWNSGDVWVIQHMNDQIGRRLTKLGCIPFIIFSLESPLFQGDFFDSFETYCNKFKHIGF